MTLKIRKDRPAAVLVGVQLPGVSTEEHFASLAELQRLCETLGLEVIAKVSQTRKAPAPGTVVGAGKLKEIAALTGGTGVVASVVQKKESKAKLRQMEEEDEGEEPVEIEDDFDDEEDGDVELLRSNVKASVVVFDTEITPMQLRNLESATDAEIMDRAGVIVEIFSRHAQTREAKLQVEIAQLSYLAPRLRLSQAGGDRQGGGIGAKGAGETAHELDKRRIRDRIAELRRQLDAIGKEQANRRSRRKEALRVALVGYTNAGKSSLMRALTGSDVLVANKLFATLDTTVRVMHPETQPRILVSDTVGFIKKLPHDLVASFRSTLDEAHAASLLLFVVDASDPTFRSQLEVTRGVLQEIEADQIPSRLVLNKADNLDMTAKARLLAEFPESIMISTRNPEDVKRVRELIIEHFEEGMENHTIHIPYAKSALIGELRQRARVLGEHHDEVGTTFTVRAHKEIIEHLKDLLRG